MATCWWSTGVEGVNAPTMAETCGAHSPAAFTTTSVSTAPWSVWTRRTRLRGVSSMPLTRTPVRIRTPSSVAALASA